MTSALVPIAGQLSLALIVGNVLVDQVGIPVPAVPTLIVAGAVAADHPVWGAELFVLAVLACIAADTLWYLAGRVYGNGVMKLLCRISVSPDSCVNETYVRFERWGPKAIVIAKFVPGLAIIAPPLAGALRMGWVRFLALTAAAASLWVGAYLAAGVLFRAQIDWLLPRAADLGGPSAALVLAALASYIAVKWWQRRKFYLMLRMARISVSELYERQQIPPAPTVVDVRSTSARSLDPRRIPGALHVPLTDVDTHLKDLPRDGEIILYCSCPNEATAARVAKILTSRGFTRVRPLHGGLEAWVEAGFAVEAIGLVAADDGRARAGSP
jgi:membrane protein DedA with SNARE-associated domain/rhodanese-related sulfurtransferase